MTCVRHVSASLSSASQLTVTGDFTYCIWVKPNSGEYGAGTDKAILGWGSTGGTSEGFNIAVLAAANTTLQAFVFRNGGSELQGVNALTGSDTSWVCIALRHTSGSASYDISFRKENVTTWTTTNVSLTTQITAAGSIFIGTDQFTENAADSDSRHFFCQAVRMSDATLLTASQGIDSAPAGTNLHWMRLLDSTTATTNGGTAGNWTSAGTLQTAATQPTEGATIDVSLSDTPAVGDSMVTSSEFGRVLGPQYRTF